MKLSHEEDIKFVYDRFEEDDALSRFLVDVIRHNTNIDILSNRFLRELLFNFARVRMGKVLDEKDLDLCDYHEHADEAAKKECRKRQ